jgi:putative nucleotidyltransferase with HDIG domain
MSVLHQLFRRLKLRNFLFALMLLSGTVPLAVSSIFLIQQNRDILETQERSSLTRSAGYLSVELNNHLATTRRALIQLGDNVLSYPSSSSMDEKLKESWFGESLQRFAQLNLDFISLRALNHEGVGPYLAPPDQSLQLQKALEESFEQVQAQLAPVYRFLSLPDTGLPVAVLTLPIPSDSDQAELFLQGVIVLEEIAGVSNGGDGGNVGVYLIDKQGQILWSEGELPGAKDAVSSTQLVTDFVSNPLNMTQEYTLVVGGKSERMIGRISAVDETGWGILVHRPIAAAFAAVRTMILRTAISSAVLVAVALLIAIFAARKVSHPIQVLTHTAKEISDGNLGLRVPASGLGRELNDLATYFNRMSDHVKDHVGKLSAAAKQNQDLFIGSMKAFVAAVDAKDPYTRGHSERVAAYSRTTSKFLGLTPEHQQRVWVGSLLHDVGKIGIDDQILNKGGVFTEEEYDRMKEHPAIGAEIMSRIEQLRDVIPIIRWHHEAWNGKGYPDGLAGEQIPLMARITAVADTFDAITTSRPYQRAYDPNFAVETITRLAGQRFDAKIVTAFLQAFEAGEIQRKSRTA